ncbi:dynein heavy chain, partial [Kipferlia bialata]
SWQHWSTVKPDYEYPEDKDPSFGSILVPTVDNTCIAQMLTWLVQKSNMDVLLIGESGSGKTVDILQFLQNQDSDRVVPRVVNFSSATTPSLFQDNIMEFVEKRMGSTYGPVAGKAGYVFIDDINMPKINEWGDTPTLEIVRQLVEERGFYSLDRPGDFLNIADISFVAAMPQPGGGRNDISDRLKSHFVVMNVTLPAAESLDHIFTTIVCGHYRESRGYDKAVVNCAQKLVGLTRTLWSATKTKMLPTPMKLHYIFNLRDLSRISQGLISSEADVVTTPKVLSQLWAHECSRVLPDKFINYEDINWFKAEMKKQAGALLGPDIEAAVAQEGVYMCNFMRDPEENEDPDVEIEIPKVYEPVEDLMELKERLGMYQGKYNDMNRRAPMDLVLFKDCVEHIVRVVRILSTPRGHALLVGVGGSGKQSVTQLATFICGYKLFRITITRTYNINNLDDDLKLLYRLAGVDGKPVTFLFTDSDVKQEVFLERLNNILTSGEVPALFAKDEVECIINDVRDPFKKEMPKCPDTNSALWEFFIDRVKSNLHVVLCFSPVGEKFRDRARKFPGLISGCTTDWFQPWPLEALTEVAGRFLGDKFKMEATEEVKQALVQHVAYVHHDMEKVTQDYFQRYRRQTYVTPKSYLSFLAGFQTLYAQKLTELEVSAHRLNSGLNKLNTAATDVAAMQVELTVKKKDLVVAQKEAAEMLVEITASTAEAEKKKAAVQKVKDALQVEADIIAKQKAEAEAGLALALPALEAAENALNAIKPADISTLKKLAKPPHLIMRIMDGVCILRNLPIDTMSQAPDFDEARKIIHPSWGLSLKMMSDMQFLNKLLSFERDAITNETCELLLPYLEMDDFNVEAAKKSSGNVAGILQWVMAMELYHRIALEVEPKRAQVRDAQTKYKIAMDQLATAQAELDEKQAALNKLQTKYDACMAEKQRLQNDAEVTQRRLGSAQALISGLSGERERWGVQSKELADRVRRLVGDVALAAGFLSYAGPFNQEYRQKLLTNIWVPSLKKRGVPFSESLAANVTAFLVTEATVGEWRLQGLPTDDLSTQNGIIVTTAPRYPLLVDPQGQGGVWIKNKEEQNDLKVTTLNNKRFRAHLEDALNLGYPLLIE